VVPPERMGRTVQNRRGLLPVEAVQVMLFSVKLTSESEAEGSDEVIWWRW